MSIITFVADCHIGNPKTFPGPTHAGINGRGEMLLKALTCVRECAEDSLVVLGDLFDLSNPSPILISRTAAALGSGGAYGHNFVLVGNHDMSSTARGHNACAPLRHIRNITVCDDPSSFANPSMLLIPYEPGPAVEWLPKRINQEVEAHGVPRAVCVHLGISDDHTSEFLQRAEDSIPAAELFRVMRVHGIKHAFAGNWHEHKRWQDGDYSITQVGAMVPTGFNNPGPRYGGYVTWDTDTDEITETRLPGPRFAILDDTAAKMMSVAYPKEFTAWARGEGYKPEDTVFLHVNTRPSREAQWRDSLIPDLVDAGAIWAGRVRVDRKMVDAAVSEAASSATSEEHFEDAIAAYVEDMEVPKGVSKSRVMSLVRKACL